VAVRVIAQAAVLPFGSYGSREASTTRVTLADAVEILEKIV
jgi:hypothetical protein